MQTKTKVIILGAVATVLLVCGIFVLINEFQNNAKESEEQAVETTEVKKSKKQKAVLELTQDEVNIEVGAEFTYEDFIKIAEDEEGYNLKDKVVTSEEISTEMPGKYKIEYELKLSNGKTLSKQLILNVVEFEKSNTPD
ncbi:immunoglobulin-like domain-containing protein [Breznakia pachnodae]|uniref:ABC-type antimicrobial peptide transport system permease subunit n=1 Tax=Breznakia pachnodae TaxID=265178 RepID=A0ABU0E6P9_9FIRM|nr:immunoglobulin-like domain-containing protein [Breznakia pachnodae]MDQ0362545.1 ABC-type antimicrobial peptide transport system permease subunit [Breznakia pachnodae]